MDEFVFLELDFLEPDLIDKNARPGRNPAAKKRRKL
jgi:hypothetical protein